MKIMMVTRLNVVIADINRKVKYHEKAAKEKDHELKAWVSNLVIRLQTSVTQ